MPLAHLLAPLITRRAEEIEAQLAPSYLQTAGVRRDAEGRRSFTDAELKQAQKETDEIEAKQGWLQKLQQHVDMVRGAQQYNEGLSARDRKLLPTAPPPPGAFATGTAEVIGMREDGTPIYASAAAPAVRPGVLPRNVIGVNERGEPVTPRGRLATDVGYLPTPQIDTPLGYIDAKRRLNRSYDSGKVGGGADVIYKPEDAAGAEWLERAYGEHLKAMEDNRDERGMPTDKLPAGYFDMLKTRDGRTYSAAEQRDILGGIKALRELQAGHKI